MVPRGGKTSNSEGHQDLVKAFSAMTGVPEEEASDFQGLYDVLDVLTEWNEHLSKAGVTLDDLEPKP